MTSPPLNLKRKVNLLEKINNFHCLMTKQCLKMHYRIKQREIYILKIFNPALKQISYESQKSHFQHSLVQIQIYDFN